MYATKNYTGKGGSETVIGGKLIIKGTLKVESGATTEGLPADPVAAYQGDAGADVNSIALLKAEHNELLAKLRAAGIMDAAPTITVTHNPENLTSLVVGSISAEAKLAASFAISNGGVLSYQWYSNASDSNEGGSAVEGATSAEYAIPTAATAGTTYYYCVASHEGVTKATNAATVTVNAA